jgi:thioesterase domain-containing protein
VEEIAHAYLREVLRVAPESPVLIGGYCNGGLATWHLAHLLRSRGAEVVELLLIETMSLNARPGLRWLPGLVAPAAAIVPGRTGELLREDGMRAIWMFARTGLTGFAASLYRAARRQFFPALQPEQEPTSGSRRAAHRRYYRLMARYVPPPLDVDVTCFIAQEGSHFDTDPNFWRGLVPRVHEVSVPGTHHSTLISERQALAAAIADALKRATSGR